MVSLSDKLQAQTGYEQVSLAVIQTQNTVKQAQGDLVTLLNLLTANAALASAMQGKVQVFYNVLISKAVLCRAVDQF